MDERMTRLRKKAMALPLQPGVYIMRGSKREIIYIGKAKALKNRVSQYFGSQNSHPEKVRQMVACVEDFDYIITDSEFEALILECSLIKQNTPKYNILLKDDKGYSYIRVTNEKWRRISYALQKNSDGARYIGPYKNSHFVKTSVEDAVKIFRLPTCSKRFPQDFGKGRPCLNFHLKQCMAPCTGRVSFSEYDEAVSSALEYLKGGAECVRQMNAQMLDAAERLDFERAAKLRDRIAAVKQLAEKQKVMESKIEQQDIIAYATDGGKGCFELFRFRGGRLVDSESFLIDEDGENDVRSDFLLQYYMMRSDIPKYIATDEPAEDRELVEKWLSQRKGERVYITCPQRGEQAQLVKMCKSNAFERLAQTKGTTGREYSALEELRELLGLEAVPEYIESYDISNLAGSENVAGMIVYENGRPLKSAYKKFKIKGFEGQDDYASMSEVLERRFNEYLRAEDKSSGFGRLPDLILLDGGKGQVNAVKPVLEKFGLDIPLFGLVKDDRHRTRAVAASGGEIEISSKRQVFTLLSKLQDEVHRFAVGYHHQSRKKNTLKSSLTEIDGIGETRARALLKHFGTITNIKNAELSELENAPAMTKPAARAVYEYFNK